jgi:tetratricopeptide (TPR) repeat protein
MASKHLTAELLEGVAEGSVTVPQLLRLLFEHVAELCPHCRESLGGLIGEALEPALVLETEIIPSAVWQQVERERHLVERTLRPAARRDLAELLALAPEERQKRIHRARKRFRNPILVDFLLERCKSITVAEPTEARSLAQLAAEIALKLPVARFGEGLARDLWIRAVALTANTYRHQGELNEAEGLMQLALSELESSPEPLLRIEVLSLAGALRKDQRRFEEAGALLDAAFATSKEINDRAMAGKILVRKASLLFTLGEVEDAIPLVREAIQLIDPARQPRLHLYAWHNLATYLCEAGQFEEARGVLQEHRTGYEHFPDFYTQNRQLWLEGKIALGLGEPDFAETAFRTAREGFVARDLGYDAALVSLDLALLYAELGRTADVRTLAEEMLPLFQAQDIHREAMAAILIFRQAAEEEVVTVQMVRELASYLEDTRYSPRARFEIPS